MAMARTNSVLAVNKRSMTVMLSLPAWRYQALLRPQAPHGAVRGRAVRQWQVAYQARV